MSVDKTRTGGKQPEPLSGAQLEAIHSFRNRLHDVINEFRSAMEAKPHMGSAERRVLTAELTRRADDAGALFQSAMCRNERKV